MPPGVPLLVWKAFRPGGRKLSDIEYLSIKEFDGKLVQNDGVLTGATGDLCTLTASSGKDMYLASASLWFSYASASGSSSPDFVLYVNGVEIERAEPNSIGAPHRDLNLVEFKSKGFKVAAGQIIKIAAETDMGDVNASGELICFEETTGDTPAV